MDNKKKKYPENEPLRYWLVELTLTSGDVQIIYVKAINQYEANQTADYYEEIAGNEKLFNLLTSEFRLMT